MESEASGVDLDSDRGLPRILSSWTFDTISQWTLLKGTKHIGKEQTVFMAKIHSWTGGVMVVRLPNVLKIPGLKTHMSISRRREFCRNQKYACAHKGTSKTTRPLLTSND